MKATRVCGIGILTSLLKFVGDSDIPFRHPAGVGIFGWDEIPGVTREARHPWLRVPSGQRVVRYSATLNRMAIFSLEFVE